MPKNLRRLLIPYGANTSFFKLKMGLGIERAYGSCDEMLADLDIEAVYIPLPNHLHFEWIRKAADAGKHILCEKPLALNAGQAAECADCAAKKGVLLMEAFAFRFHPQWQRVRDLVRIGEIGDVHAIHVIFSVKSCSTFPILGADSFGPTACIPHVLAGHGSVSPIWFASLPRGGSATIRGNHPSMSAPRGAKARAVRLGQAEPRRMGTADQEGLRG